MYGRGLRARRELRSDGRIGRISRFNDRITADVQGSRSYDVTVDLSATPFEATCTCPYDGPGTCKHIVAVLEVTETPPDDEQAEIESILDGVTPEALRSFLFDELARNPELRDRFRARFDDNSRSVDEYRGEIKQLFHDHTVDYPLITEAIDFSHFFEQAEQHRSRDRYREAATIYRAITEGVERNEDRIDAAYDHYARSFKRALDGYVECVRAADLSDEAYQEAVTALAERAGDAIGLYAEQYRNALDRLEEDT